MTTASQFCTFYLDGALFAVEVDRVQEVLRYQDMTNVPLTSEVIEGLINLRGQIVTAIDLRRRLSLPARPAGSQPMNVVVRTEGDIVSLLVDEIGEVLEVPDDAFEHTPSTLQGPAKQLVQGVYKLDGSLLLLLDVQHTMQFDPNVEAIEH
ncbi:MAG: chemotaxis protein CheW [Planctomycetes bacterium]|nr:chemotaxis protein CheW [Planctomycetota bacterium]